MWGAFVFVRNFSRVDRREGGDETLYCRSVGGATAAAGCGVVDDGVFGREAEDQGGEPGGGLGRRRDDAHHLEGHQGDGGLDRSRLFTFVRVTS